MIGSSDGLHVPREQAIRAAAEVYLEAKIRIETEKAIARIATEAASRPAVAS